MQNTATNKQYTELLAITLSAVQQYIDFCKLCEVDDDLDTANIKTQVNMHFGDLAYITNALTQFAQTKNMQELHSSIMQQDTFVREYFINTLRYLEHNTLVNCNYCV